MLTRLSPVQIRGARGMLDWSMQKLAGSAKLSITTVQRMEKGSALPVSDQAFASVQVALERAGISFLDDTNEGLGLRLRRS